MSILLFVYIVFIFFTRDVYANSREMTADVEGLTPDTLYDVQVAMVYNGFISDYGDRFSVRTFSDGNYAFLYPTFCIYSRS